jgi:DNA-binding protein HU-beta
MANFNKEDLVVAISGVSGISKAEAERQLNNVMAGIKSSVDKMEVDDKLQLVGLMTFEIVEKPAHTAKNPRTGEKVDVPAQKKLKIKAGSKLAELAK